MRTAARSGLNQAHCPHRGFLRTVQHCPQSIARPAQPPGSSQAAATTPMSALAAQRCAMRAAAPAAATQAAARPAAPLLPPRRGAAAAPRRRLAPVRAEPFNEGAAQVRRLVDRDRKELNLDELEAAFGEDPAPSAAAPSSAAAADAAGSSSAAPAAAPRSPFQVNSSQAGACSCMLMPPIAGPVTAVAV